jgi:2-succinyl-5-enolpyruvyl-6-hydroxy-3-cyclohexene-1-carboxylate synthase
VELSELASGRRGIIVAGAGSGDPDGVHELAGILGWPVLADPRSGCRRPGHTTVAAFDALLRHGPLAAELTPEVVLRAGAPPASKVLAGWLAASRADQAAVETHGSWLDPQRTARVVVAADPGAAFRAMARSGPAPCAPGWLETWAVAESTAQEALDRVLARHRAPTEPGIARALVDCLPTETTLVVSSSMPVRDVEWFARPRQDVRVVANRGANGIDGVVSTVLGAAASRPGYPTAGLLGDLALLHDAGALLGAALRELNCVMVVVDNDGGGIFSFLPQASALPDDEFERLFATPHGLDLAALARLHGIATCEVERLDELAPAVGAGFKAGATTMIVVRTEQRANVRVHDELHDAVAASLDELDRRAG